MGICSAGIYTNSYDAALNVKNGFPVFSTLIEANAITKHEDAYAASLLTDEDKDTIHSLARDQNISAGLPLSWRTACT